MPGLEFDESRCKRACEHISRRIVRPLIERSFRTGALAVSVKDNESIVTETDRTIERGIRAYLEEEFPGFGLIGEEFGPKDTGSEYVWTIDPIDGTEAFVAGVPLFGTLLAVIRQTRDGARLPIFGALYLPMQDQLVLGNRVETTLDGRSIKMGMTPALARERLLLGDLSEIARKVPAVQQERLLRLASQYRSAQTWGDCFGYVSMLQGEVHARIDVGLGVDDIAPLEPIIIGAGGIVTSWDGTALSQVLSGLPDLSEPSSSFSSVSASSRRLHDEVMSAIWAS